MGKKLELLVAGVGFVAALAGGGAVAAARAATVVWNSAAL